MENSEEFTLEAREEVARLIEEGYTSGRLDSEDGTKVSWELKVEVWKD